MHDYFQSHHNLHEKRHENSQDIQLHLVLFPPFFCASFSPLESFLNVEPVPFLPSSLLLVCIKLYKSNNHNIMVSSTWVSLNVITVIKVWQEWPIMLGEEKEEEERSNNREKCKSDVKQLILFSFYYFVAFFGGR